MKRAFELLRVFLFAAGIVLAQTSNYPAAIDNDRSLFVVADNVQTSLTASMSASDTQATVSNAAGFVVNMIVTICDTATNTGKCTVWEHMLVTGVAGNSLTVQRGFAGTSARTHAAGKLVSALIDAAHQQSLKSAIVNIETALGANLSTVYLSFVASKHNFAPQSPGIAMVAGNNAVTLAPVPAGVNGTDFNHYLWVSGGSGTPEACLINGGSATSGSASGQVILQCAYSHSGSYTISSLSGGVQEAVQAAQSANGGQVVIDSPITANFTSQGSTLVGSYPAAVTINSANVNVSCGSLKNGLFPTSTFSQSADLVLIQPTTAPIFGMAISGCSFYPSSGTAGRHILHVQLRGSPYQFTSQFAYYNITGNRFGHFDGTSYFQSAAPSVYFDNSAGNLNGIYAGSFAGANQVVGGLKTTGFGDSNNIVGNRFSGNGPGIDLDILQVSANLGASQTTIEKNNFWINTSAPLVVRSGIRIAVTENNFETTQSAPGSNNAQVDVQGSAALPVYNIWFTRNLFSMQSNGSGGQNYIYAVNLDRAQGVKFLDNVWGGATAPQAGVKCSANTGDIFGDSWTQAPYDLVPAKIAYAGCLHVNTQILMGAGASAPYALGGVFSTGLNYLGPSSGANNAISTPGGTAVEAPIGPPLTAGLCVTLYLQHSLQAGPNTFAYQGGSAVSISSHRGASNIGAAYATGALIQLCYNGATWQDMSQ